MTLVRCGTCGRPGLMCECEVATARGDLFGIPAMTYGRWAPTKTESEPLTLEAIERALLETERRLSTYRPRTAEEVMGPHWRPPLAGMGDKG